MKHHLEVIAAVDQDHGLGKNGRLPWDLPGDLARFERLTRETAGTERQSAVLMGRKTWQSLPHGGLPGRVNIVISRQERLPLRGAPGPAVAGGSAPRLARSLGHALAQLAEPQSGCSERAWVIGGGQIYQLALQLPQCRRIHLTRVSGSYGCDVFFPLIDRRSWELSSTSRPQEENGIEYAFELYERR